MKKYNFENYIGSIFGMLKILKKDGLIITK